MTEPHPLSDREMDLVRQEAMEFAGVGLYRYSFDGTVLFMDRGALRILDLEALHPDPDTVVGRNISELIVYTGPRQRLREEVRKHGHVRNLEYSFRTLTGLNRWALHDSYLVPAGEPGREAIQVIIRDITNIKEAETESRESRERLVGIVGSAMDAIISVEADQRIVLFNAAAEKMFGCTAAEACGGPLARFIPERYRAAHTEHIRRFGETGVTARQIGALGEISGLRANGEEFPIEASISQGTAAGHKLFTVILRDVTERKRAEQEREALIKELEAKNAELERFTYTVSHDLKSPLITIKAFTELLAQDAAAGDAERMRSDMGHISQAADKMHQLLDDLLQLSRIGRLVNAFQETPLADLARETVNLLAGQIAQRGVRVDISADLPVVLGDRPRLLEVLQNLIDNAVKFMGDQSDPRIELGVRQDGGESVCYVRDNGMGVDPRYHQRVFGLFQKLDASREGTGVGLALVKRIVEVHGGRIWVESEGPGRGSTFCFTLPAKGLVAGPKGVTRERRVVDDSAD